MNKINVFGFLLVATVASQAIAVGEGVPEVVAATPCAVGVTPQPPCPQAFQGFYLGGNVGYNLSSAKISATDARTGFKETVKRKHTQGVDGGLGVGYLHRWCNWGFGIAFDVNWANTKGTFDVFNKVVKCNTREKNSFDLYGRLGYVIRDMVMPFVGLGWSNQKWKETATITNFQLPDGSFYSNSAKKSKRINAFLWKLGVDFLATQHFVLGIEYTGTTGQKFSPRSSDRNVRVGVTPQYNKVALTAKIVY